MLIGFLAGGLSGLTGAVGLLFNKFYLRYGLQNEEIIATRAANEILLHAFKIIIYSVYGLISIYSMGIGFAVALSAICSSISIKWILPRISAHLFKKIGYLAMVLSGILMLGQSWQNIMLMNKGQISSALIAKGIETKLQWQNASYSLEFTYDDGFEVEQIIPFSELSQNRQEYVLTQLKVPYDKIVIEEVYTIRQKYYEAYVFDSNFLIRKIEFK